MHSGQTRAVLLRKERAGDAIGSLLREKRMSDLAWQMNVMSQKLCACPREKRAAKERLLKLYGEAKAKYDRLLIDLEMEKAPEDYGVYLG